MHPHVARKRITFVESEYVPSSRRYVLCRLDPLLTASSCLSAAGVALAHLLLAALFLTFACQVSSELRTAALLYVPLLLIVAAPFLACVTQQPVWLIALLACLVCWQSIPEWLYPDSPYAHNWGFIVLIVTLPWILQLVAKVGVRRSLRGTTVGAALVVAALSLDRLQARPPAASAVTLSVAALLPILGIFLIRTYAGRLAADMWLAGRSRWALVELSRSPWNQWFPDTPRAGERPEAWRRYWPLGIPSLMGFLHSLFLFPTWRAHLQALIDGDVLTYPLIESVAAVAGWIVFGSVLTRLSPLAYVLHAIGGATRAVVLWWIDEHPVPNAVGVFSSKQFETGPYDVRTGLTSVVLVGVTAVLIIHNPIFQLEEVETALERGRWWQTAIYCSVTVLLGAVLVAMQIVLITGSWFAQIGILRAQASHDGRLLEEIRLNPDVWYARSKPTA